MDPAGVDLANSNVLDLKKGRMIDSMLLDGKGMMNLILQLERLRIKTSNVKMTWEKAFVPGMSGAYGADLLRLRLKGLIKVREQIARMAIRLDVLRLPLRTYIREVKSGMGEKTIPTDSATVAHCRNC